MGTQTMTIQIDAKVQWARKRLQSGAWIGVCDALGLTIEASNEAELVSMIEESMSLLFMDIFADGELEQFLQARGWMAKSPIPTGIQAGIENGVRFDVPFELRPWSAVNA
jgi:hypothetical protein